MMQSVIGLNNGGTVAAGLAYPFTDTNSDGSAAGNLTDKGMATCTNGGVCVPLTAVPNLLTSSLSFGGIGYTNGTPGDLVYTERGNYPTGINDSNMVIGMAGEWGTGPYWGANVAVKNSAYVGAATIFDGSGGGGYSYGSPVTDPSGDAYLQGGQSFNLTGINNSGRMIGTYVDITTSDTNYLGIPITAAPMKSFYGTSASDTHPLVGLLTAINDNGVISGTDIGGTTNLIWMPKTGGGYNRKIVNYYGAPTGYVNNKMQTASGWQDYRVQNWSNLCSSIPTNWSSITGESISHDSGIIVANATTNSVQHAVLLVPCGFRLLNGSTNNADVDGKDFNGNRPTTISATTNYNSQSSIDIGNASSGNVGMDVIGTDLPLGTGRPGLGAGRSYVHSIMVLAKVAPASTNITYAWDRVYEDQSIGITHTSTNTWYVDEASGSSTTPIEDTGTNEFYTVIPSTNNNIVNFYDNPGMLISNFATTAYKTNDYAYEKTDFTYSLTNSIGSANAVAQQHVGQIIIAQRIGTSGTITNDWVGITNIVSTTNIPDCTIITTSEIRTIVGGTDTIIFAPSVPH